jgi:uncharacterized protein
VPVVDAAGDGEVGSVAELWRFPVKSLQGEPVDELELTAGGFVGDRRYALVDRGTGKVLSAKTVPQLLFGSARSVGDAVVVTLPDGTEHDAADPASSVALASWIDRDVALLPADAVGSTTYEMTFDPEDDTAELYDIPVAPGTFFDLTPVHALTTGSLATMAAAHPSGAWDVRRFRPNVLIATPPPPGGAAAPAQPVPPGEAHPGFPEDAWTGGTLRCGAASVTVVMPAVRCAMPPRAQPGIERDLAIYRTMAAHHGNHLGIYAAPAEPGLVRVGDPVSFDARPTGAGG